MLQSSWQEGMDLNHKSDSQSVVCYHYTTLLYVGVEKIHKTTPVPLKLFSV